MKHNANQGSRQAIHSFSQTPSIQKQRSQFNRSHGLKTTFDAGLLIPIFADEALPGDTHNLRVASFCRLATPIFPVMDNMFMDFFFFFVPNRLIWDNWEKFMGAQDDPGDSIDFLVPRFVAETPALHSLSDYMGIPQGQGDVDFNSLHHRAYNLIFNEWFRDQNLTDSLVVDKDDGPDTLSDYVVQRRAKRHDYLTSCLPFTQKGDPVGLPLGGTVPVIAAGNDTPLFTGTDWANTNISLVGAAGVADAKWAANAGAAAAKWSTTSLEVDLSSSAAATVNALRQAFQIQKLLDC